MFQAAVEKLVGPLTEIERRYAPETLYWEGDAALLAQGPRVSIVGSRRASDDGLRRGRKLARQFSERGIVVVSGLAAGIDAVAHRAAMASGGSTIAVLGSPLDKPYPAANAALFEEICRDHLAVSQFAPGTPIQRRNFPMRNRTMALLSDATVIVEAGAKSGTAHQGWEAIRLGRPLFLLKSLTAHARQPWIDDLLEHGAQVLSDENLGQVMDELPAFASIPDVVAI